VAGRPVILLSDPVPDTRVLLDEVFRTELNAYVVAVDGTSAALLMAREVRPALVVVELDARRADELTLLAALKSDPTPGTPVLALTAWGQGLTCEQALAAGCDDCMPKPFDLDDLLARLQTLLAVRAYTPGTKE
jgi:CheY-like chemotaxis protein